MHGLKFDYRSQNCVFLGFSPGTKGFLLYDLSSRELFLSRDVHFYETTCPFNTLSSSSVVSNAPLLQFSSTTEYDGPLCLKCTIPNSISPHHSIASSSHNSNDITHSTASPNPDIPSQNPLQIKKSSQIKTRPTYLQDYHCNLLNTLAVQSNSGTPYPFSNYLSYDKFSPQHKHFSLPLSSQIEPKTYKQASSQDCWI